MIYFAAPLFSPIERQFNSNLAKRLHAFDQVFLPQRDGLLVTELVRSGVSVSDAEQEVFRRDTRAIHECVLLVAVLDGAVVDAGVAFEIGAAFSRDIPCVGLQTDSRRQLPTGNNPMISQALLELFHSEEELVYWCREYLTSSGDRSRWGKRVDLDLSETGRA